MFEELADGFEREARIALRDDTPDVDQTDPARPGRYELPPFRDEDYGTGPEASWQPVTLPHDFVVEGEVCEPDDKDPTLHIAGHGYLPMGVGFYRKVFTLPAEDRGRRIRIEFDGVCRDSNVWVNGHPVGRHASGYTNFHYDITDLLRYGAYAVTWLICGEYNDKPARVPKVLALGQFIKDRDPWKRAMTVHPAWHGGDKHQAWDQPWCDFIMIQGAADTNIPVSVYLNAYRHQPAKPVIESECNYEGISSMWSNNRRALTDSDVRWAAYRALQSGCAGFTYGAHGLWYPKLDEMDTAFVKEYGPAPLWDQALRLPGGAQMSFLRAVYESVNWPLLEPHPNGILLEPQGTPAHFDQALLKSQGDQVFLVYLLKTTVQQAKFAVTGARVGESYTATWFDPRTGKTQSQTLLRATGQGKLSLPDRPDLEDWLFILRLKTP